MHIEFTNPGFEYMLNSIMEFQKDDVSSFWNDSLFYFFKELDKEYAYSLLPEKRREYFKEKMLEIYRANEKLLEEKLQAYSRYWNLHRVEIEQAFSDAFEVDCSNLFNDLVCKISLNPISPRYLIEHTFDTIQQGLLLLCDVAKSHGVEILYDDIAIDNPAIKLFLKVGFCEEYRTDEIIMLKKEL